MVAMATPPLMALASLEPTAMAVLPFLATASTCRGDSQWGRRQRFGLVNHLHCTTAASLATVKSRIQAGGGAAHEGSQAPLLSPGRARR